MLCVQVSTAAVYCLPHLQPVSPRVSDNDLSCQQLHEISALQVKQDVTVLNTNIAYGQE